MNNKGSLNRKRKIIPNSASNNAIDKSVIPETPERVYNNQENMAMVTSSLTSSSTSNAGYSTPKKQILGLHNDNFSPLILNSMTWKDKKPGGKSDGYVGTTPRKKRSYIVKRGFSILSRSSSSDEAISQLSLRERSDTIYEFIFDPLYQFFLGNKIPASRLLIKNNIVSTASRILIGFKTLTSSPIKPNNLEEIIGLKTFFGDDDWHSDNLSSEGDAIDHGRSSALRTANAELFVHTIEFLFKSRYTTPYGFTLDYQALADTIERIRSVDNKDQILNMIRSRIAILKEQSQNKDLRDIEFLDITINHKILNFNQFRTCIKAIKINSWEELEARMVNFINKQYAMIQDILSILDERCLEEEQSQKTEIASTTSSNSSCDSDESSQEVSSDSSDDSNYSKKVKLSSFASSPNSTSISSEEYSSSESGFSSISDETPNISSSASSSSSFSLTTLPSLPNVNSTIPLPVAIPVASPIVTAFSTSLHHQPSNQLPIWNFPFNYSPNPGNSITALSNSGQPRSLNFNDVPIMGVLPSPLPPLVQCLDIFNNMDFSPQISNSSFVGNNNGITCIG